MFFSKSFKYIGLSLALLSLPQRSKPGSKKVILFDMEGVLIKTHQASMALQEFGITNLFNISLDMVNGYFSHFFFDNQPPFMKKRLFQVLERIGGSQSVPADEYKATNKGLVLPQILCDWMTDKYSPAQIRINICQGIKKLEKEGFFISKEEKRYLRKILLTMFTSEVLARHTHPLKEGFKLLKDLAHCKKKRKNSLIFGVLSNAASELFDMKQKETSLQPIFKHIHKEYIFISGKLGTMKPYSNTYTLVIEKLKKDGIINNASEIIFIDDQAENVCAAQKQGITALHLKNYDYRTLRKQLHKLRVL